MPRTPTPGGEGVDHPVGGSSGSLKPGGGGALALSSLLFFYFKRERGVRGVRSVRNPTPMRVGILAWVSDECPGVSEDAALTSVRAGTPGWLDLHWGLQRLPCLRSLDPTSPGGVFCGRSACYRPPDTLILNSPSLRTHPVTLHNRSLHMNRALILTLIVLTFLAVGCGGGGGSASSSPVVPTGPQSPAGIFTGTIQSSTSGKIAATAIVLDSGEFRYVAANGLQAVGNISVSGSAFSGSSTLFAPCGYAFPGGVFTLPATLTNGSVITANHMGGSYSGAGDSGTFDFAYNPASTHQLTLASLVGNYDCMLDPYLRPVSINVKSDGSFSVYLYVPSLVQGSGTITQPNPSQNAFRIQLYMPGYGPYPIASNYSGLGFLTDGSSPNSVFNFYLTDQGGQWPLVLIKR